MKRFLSFSSLTAALILHVAIVNTHIPEKNIGGGMQSPFVCTDDTESVPNGGHFYITSDAPFIPAGLNSIPGSRVPFSFFKTVNNPYNTLKSCLLNLIHRKIHIIRTAFFLHYSKKEKDGYYIYALRKLLI
ncbi:MAG: hypothetical protein LBJ47_01995 [Tannerella sp.]|jgi:hypothetical protein|nr:hypothetical protein [Tannerella sp.]